MSQSMYEVMHPVAKDARFPFAPPQWQSTHVEQQAAEEGLSLTDDHWEVVRALQEYFAKNETPNVRELHDALDEKFHARGGIRHLYQLLPGGPVAQGCRLAGLNPPAGAVDGSFGSVQ